MSQYWISLTQRYLKLLEGWAQDISPRKHGGSQRALIPTSGGKTESLIIPSTLILNRINLFRYR